MSEEILSQALRALLARVPVGGELGDLCYRDAVGKRALSALEHYLPATLRVVHPFWKLESLDAFRLAIARKTGADSAELLGLALLITDQAWTPFQLALRLRATAAEVEWLECRVGEATATGLLKIPYGSPRTNKILSELPQRQAEIDWAYGVSFDETSEKN